MAGNPPVVRLCMETVSQSTGNQLCLTGYYIISHEGWPRETMGHMDYALIYSPQEMGYQVSEHDGNSWGCYTSWLNLINSLWPGDDVWWYRSGSTLAQVMVWCLTAPSHVGNGWDGYTSWLNLINSLLPGDGLVMLYGDRSGSTLD